MGPIAKRLLLDGRRKPYTGFPTLAQLAASGLVYFDHRGWPNTYPEETLKAYRESVNNGAQFVEFDVQSLSDKTLVVMHDTTVDRTTTSVGAVNSFDLPGWRALVIDAGTFLGGGWGNFPAPVFSELLREFSYKNVLLCVEVKSYPDGTGAALLQMLTGFGVDKRRTLVNSFSAAELTQFTDAGWTTCINYGTYAGAPTPADILATGVTWVAVDSTTATAQMDALRAAGLKVIVYTLDTRYSIAVFSAHCDGVFTNEGAYARGTNLMRRTTDPFVLQTWYAGQQAVNGSGDGGGRGAFALPNLWGYDLSASNTWVGALQGWASPMNGVLSETGALLNSAVINLSIKFTSAFAADRFAWIFIGVDDRGYSTDVGAPAIDGYNFLFRKSGLVQILKITAGVVSDLGSTVGTAIADGATITGRITVTATQLKIERLDVPTSKTAADAAYRGAYLQMGVKGCYAQFSDVSLSFP